MKKTIVTSEQKVYQKPSSKSFDLITQGYLLTGSDDYDEMEVGGRSNRF